MRDEPESMQPLCGVSDDLSAELFTVIAFAPGEKVYVHDDLLEGRIIRVQLSANDRIQYEVAWWDGNVRHEAWLESFEVFPCSSSARQIGFKGQGL
jgi:hypothetical protein